MKTPKEYLKRISPNDDCGVREHLQKEGLRGVVENIMQRYAEYYHDEQLRIANVSKCVCSNQLPRKTGKNEHTCMSCC